MMKTIKHHRNIRLPDQTVQTMLVLEEEIYTSRLPEAKREQSIRLLVELLLSVDKEASGEGGDNER